MGEEGASGNQVRSSADRDALRGWLRGRAALCSTRPASRQPTWRSTSSGGPAHRGLARANTMIGAFSLVAARRTLAATFVSMPCGLRRTASSKSTPWPRHQASAWAGFYSTLMPGSPRLRSGSAPSRSSMASCSMCTVNRPLGSSSRFGAWAAATCPKPRGDTTASAWAIPRRRRDSASGRGPARPTPRAISRSPASVAMLPSASMFGTDDLQA